MLTADPVSAVVVLIAAVVLLLSVSLAVHLHGRRIQKKRLRNLRKWVQSQESPGHAAAHHQR